MKNSTPYIHPSFIRGNYWISKTSLKWIDKFGHENSMLSIRTKQKEKSSKRATPLLHSFSRSSSNYKKKKQKEKKKKQIRKNKKREERKPDVAWKPIVAKQRQTGENDA